MPVDVQAGKSKRRYKMSVGDKGRTFHDPDSGEELDEATFKEREGDYSTVGGGDQVVKAGGYYAHDPRTGSTSFKKVESGAQESQISKADLGAAARANRAKATPTPTPNPDDEKEKQKKALSRKY